MSLSHSVLEICNFPKRSAKKYFRKIWIAYMRTVITAQIYLDPSTLFFATKFNTFLLFQIFRLFGSIVLSLLLLLVLVLNTQICHPLKKILHLRPNTSVQLARITTMFTKSVKIDSATAFTRNQTTTTLSAKNHGLRTYHRCRNVAKFCGIQNL